MAKKQTEYERQYEVITQGLTKEQAMKEKLAKREFKKMLKHMKTQSKDIILEEVEMRQDSIRRLYREQDKLKGLVADQEAALIAERTRGRETHEKYVQQGHKLAAAQNEIQRLAKLVEHQGIVMSEQAKSIAREL